MIKIVRECTKTVKWEKKSDDIDDHGDPRMKEDAEKVISGEYIEDPEARRTRLVQEQIDFLREQIEKENETLRSVEQEY
jgi:hypothetical protein